MGWRGTLRTLGAIAREAERDSRRRAREHTRYLAQVEKVEARQRAAAAAQESEDFLRDLVSAHCTCSKTIDWVARASAPPPTKPERRSDREDAARRKLVTYQPSFFTRLLRQTERRRAKLEKAVTTARSIDESEFASKSAAYEKALADYGDEMDLAGRMLAKDPEAMLEFLKVLNPFGSVAQLGESLHITISPVQVAIEVNVHGEEVVPKEIPRLLASGRLSYKALPKREYYKLYQDHVCSSALRVARETLAALPVDKVLINAVDDLIDQSTGNLVKTIVLSLLAPRATMDRLNFQALDPSDAMRNFLHRMDFRPTEGFRRVDAVDVEACAVSRQ